MKGRQRLILLSAILGSAVVTIDSSVVTVALHTISAAASRRSNGSRTPTCSRFRR